MNNPSDNLDDELARMERAADKAEAELEALRSQLISRADADRLQEDFKSDLRRVFEELPTRYAKRWRPDLTQDEVQSRLEEVVLDMLEDMYVVERKYIAELLAWPALKPPSDRST